MTMHIDPRLPEIDDCLYRVSVKGIIVNEHKLLLVKEQNDAWWSLPGGGIDYGETIEQALRREMSEELGVDPKTVTYDDNILFVTVGAVVAGVPKANLFYRVRIPIAAITPTSHVLEHTWCGADDISELYLSPSTGNIIEQITKILNAGGSYEKTSSIQSDS